MPRARSALVLVAAGCLAGTGCFQAHNPTYFPNWGWEGPITRTHAKPAGHAYFKNYDPKACKIELAPGRCNNPPGAQQVLIASVVDADGQPRRSRRVEWILDGPGYIVEVDESGYYSGRGYKVDNKYAVSYTDYHEHAITRGSDNPRDSFTIRPGQTWCVVSCAVEGQTTVTAYAPEVFSWENGRTTTVLTWGPPGGSFGPADPDGGVLPPPVISRTGGTAAVTASTSKSPELTLTVSAPKQAALGRETAVTLVAANSGGAESQPVTVRSVVPDGVEFVSADPPADRQGRSLAWALGPLSGGQTRPVKLVVRPTQRGTVEVAASAETPDGLRAEKRATVPVGTAEMTAAIDAPKSAAVGEPVSVSVAVTNTGGVPVDGANVFFALDEGLTAEDGTVQPERPLGTIAPGQTKRAELRATAKAAGTYRVRANVTADGGLTARAEAAVALRRAGLSAAVTGPDRVALGEEAVWEVRAANTGDVPLTGVTVRANLPHGLTLSGRAAAPGSGDLPPTDAPAAPGLADLAEWPVGTLAPGERKTWRLTAVADTIATGTIRVTATSDGPRTTATAPVAVLGRPALTVELADPPGVIPVGRRATVRVRVRNTGTAPAKRIEVTLGGSPEVTVRSGVGPDRTPGQVEGGKLAYRALDELPAGGTATFTADLAAAAPGAARLTAEVRADHLTQPVRDEQSARVVP